MKEYKYPKGSDVCTSTARESCIYHIKRIGYDLDVINLYVVVVNYKCALEEYVVDMVVIKNIFRVHI